MKIDNEYNTLQLEKIDKLLSQNREFYKVDLHIHTSYSTDGIQTVKEAICKAKEGNFDIISFADHDSILAYEDVLNEKLYDDPNNPIIIPGVEFTVSYPEYKGRCHVLKYFFNINDPRFINNIAQNKAAYDNRIDLWFQRISENKVLRFFSEDCGVLFSKGDYLEYLKTNEIKMPDYSTLMEYLFSVLNVSDINVWDVYEKSLEINDLDFCITRKEKKSLALSEFYEKYKDKDIAYNYRKLRPILAPVGIDDNDYQSFESSGSLSINEFGQIYIGELDNSGVNIIAHPDQNKLNSIFLLADVIHGFELNYRSENATNEIVYSNGKGKNYCITRGSDKHVNSDYENTDFYNMSSSELKHLVKRARELLYNLE